MIKRKILNDLENHLSQKEISLIIGSRQAGKTTLMLQLEDLLKKEGQKTIFLNLDIEADKRFFESQEILIKKIQLEIGKEKGFVFIDEMQRKENAGLFLKGIYDMNLPYKLIVSGSGSIELKEKIHESLVGRKRVFELSTITFEEFINFQTGYRYQDRVVDFLSLEKPKAEILLKEYITFGGYPRVVLAETLEEKRKIIDDIYRSYLEKDIVYLLGVQKKEEFINLVRILASQVGNLINISELSSTVGISVKTIKDYLWYLEKTFVTQKITPFYANLRKEITKSPVIYFSDLGLRNYAFGTFGNIENIKDVGFIFQNFIFNILKEKIKSTPVTIHFWRTKDGAEVDFVVNLVKVQIPLEAKYKSLRKAEITRSLRSYIEKYKPLNAFVVNLSLEETITLDRTKIEFLPFSKLGNRLNNLLTVGHKTG